MAEAVNTVVGVEQDKVNVEGFILTAVGAIVFASNGPIKEHGVVGCCRSFGVGCVSDHSNDTIHATHVRNSQIEWKNREQLVAEHYVSVHHDLSLLDEEDLMAFKAACIKYEAW